MNFYRVTLDGIYKLLNDCNKTSYADMIAYCIEKWDTRKDTAFFHSVFSEKGAFKNFRFEKSDFSSDEKFFWTQELFSALVAMAVQLAKFIANKKSCNIDFIRKNFGHENQIIYGSECSNCGFRRINAVGVDRYISTSIIAKRIVDGLENGNLNDNIEAIMTLSAPEIQRERERTKARIINTPIPFNPTSSPLTFCLLCGSKDIKECKFLKSIKAPVFVPLGINNKNN